MVVMRRLSRTDNNTRKAYITKFRTGNTYTLQGQVFVVRTQRVFQTKLKPHARQRQSNNNDHTSDNR